MTKAEMIRAAAERVMGWYVYESGRGSTVAMIDKDLDTEREVILATTHPWERVEWSPAEVDADALMLVDRLAAQGWDYQIVGEEGQPVRVRLTPPCPGPYVDATAPTRAEAITQACLLAVGVEVPDGE